MLEEIAFRVFVELVNNDEFREKIAKLGVKLIDCTEVTMGLCDLNDLKYEIKTKTRQCLNKDFQSRVKVTAFITALYTQHKIQRTEQISGSLLKQFGKSWFPKIDDSELRFALEVDSLLEDKIHSRVLERYDREFVKAGKVNQYDCSKAIQLAQENCIRKDRESQARVSAYIKALYKQYNIHRAAQVGGSLLQRFGKSWFPRIHDRELRFALDVDSEIEAYMYSIEENK